jgi:site-specific recombinase XerD
MAPKANGNRSVPRADACACSPLGEDVHVALKTHRHLRSPLVFCNADGRMLTDSEQKNPLPHACKRAGLRSVGWHTLRHSFASHLAMRGVTLKVIQELLGHASILMTMRYAHLAPQITRDAVRMLDRAAHRGSLAAA